MDTDRFSSVLKKELGEEVKEHETLRDYTTMRVGGVADFLYIATTMEAFIKALKICFEHRIPYLIIAGGSNVIVSDGGFPGLVIINRTSATSFIPEKSQAIVDSGCIYARLITEAASRELGGLEWWFGIPGTVGGAVHNNAETWGHDMSEVVKTVTLLFPPTDEKGPYMKQVSAEWFHYSYRSSKLKNWKREGKPVILTVTLQLRQQPKEEIMRKMKDYKQGRWDLNQPKGAASAGSFFRNPGGPSHVSDVDRKPHDSAGWLLDQVGAKRVTKGEAAVSPMHANFLINKGNASAQDMHELARELKQKVKDTFDVELQEEVEYVGVWPDETEARQ